MSIYAELTLNWFLFSSFDVHSYMFSELWLFDILSRVKKGLVIRMRICGRILWKEITFSLSYNFKFMDKLLKTFWKHLNWYTFQTWLKYTLKSTPAKSGPFDCWNSENKPQKLAFKWFLSNSAIYCNSRKTLLFRFLFKEWSLGHVPQTMQILVYFWPICESLLCMIVSSFSRCR